MENSRLRKSFLFILFLLLFGTAGTFGSGAATTKYTVPKVPTNVSAVGELESARLKWKAPSSNGGKQITSYKVVFNPGNNIYICKSSSTTCLVPIKNPNKPSSKPQSIWYNFSVAAVNSIGTGPQSDPGNTRALIRFRATITIAPKYGPAVTPTPTPTPTATATTFPQRPGIMNFDGKYQGTAVVTVTQNENIISALSSTLNTSDIVLNGDITGTAGIWKVNGYVTDATGLAIVTASNSLLGAMTFTLTFFTDSVTQEIKGAGKGTSTIDYAGFGNIKVVFDFSISNKVN